MNGTTADLAEVQILIAAHPAPKIDLLICPPATLLAQMNEVKAGHALALGGQDCHAAPNGAHTGDISAKMLATSGASYVILGHSERRTNHHETSDQVAAKAATAHETGLSAIICIGETLTERDEGQTLQVVEAQLLSSTPAAATPQNTVIAYEPVWAIGTGKVATLDQIAEVHAAIRASLTRRFGTAGAEFRILYGGSVKPDNAAEIFAVANVDGALVGGASLRAADFTPIIQALENA